MGYLNHPRVYDPAVMVSIKAAFSEVWTTLERDPTRGATADQALKVAVIQRLIDLAAQGTTGPAEFKAQVLKSLPQGWSSLLLAYEHEPVSPGGQEISRPPPPIGWAAGRGRSMFRRTRLAKTRRATGSRAKWAND